MADIIIRLVDIYEAMLNAGLIEHSLDEILKKKIVKNMERPPLHGNKF